MKHPSLPQPLPQFLAEGRRVLRQRALAPLLQNHGWLPVAAGMLGLGLGWLTGWWPLGVALGLLGVGVALGRVRARLRRHDLSPLAVAAWVDGRLGLEERFCTVVDLRLNQPEHPFLPRLEQQLKEKLPLQADLSAARPPPAWRWRGAVAVALTLPLLALVLPPPPSLAQKRRENELSLTAQKALAKAAQNAARELKKSGEKQDDKTRRELLKQQQKLLDLARKLQEGKLNRQQALGELEKAKKSLRQSQQPRSLEQELQAQARRRLGRRLAGGKSSQEQCKAVDDALRDFQRRKKSGDAAPAPPLPRDKKTPFTHDQSKDVKDALGLDNPPKDAADALRQLEQKQQQDKNQQRLAEALDNAEKALDQWRPDGSPGQNPQSGQGQQTASNQGQQGQGQQGPGQQSQGQQGQGKQGQQGQQGQGQKGQQGQGKQGQGQQGQQGQGQQGQGQQGQGQGQGGQAGGQGGGQIRQAGGGGGQGPRAADAGRGTTNLRQQGQQTRARNHDGRQFDGFKPQWREAYKRLYKSVAVDRQGTVTRVGGQRHNAPDKGHLPAQAPFGEETWRVEAGSGVIPPGRGAEEALDEVQIPPGYEETVKDYFDAINGQ